MEWQGLSKKRRATDLLNYNSPLIKIKNMMGTTFGFFFIKEKLKFSAFPSSGAQYGSRETPGHGGRSWEATACGPQP